MDKELIKRFIQKAIDNGLTIEGRKVVGVRILYGDIWLHYMKNGNKHSFEDYFNLIELITSKEFIKAIAKYKRKKLKDYKDGTGKIDKKEYYPNIERLEYRITIDQAIAIKDYKLEGFILLIKGEGII